MQKELYDFDRVKKSALLPWPFFSSSSWPSAFPYCLLCTDSLCSNRLLCSANNDAIPIYQAAVHIMVHGSEMHTSPDLEARLGAMLPIGKVKPPEAMPGANGCRAGFRI